MRQEHARTATVRPEATVRTRVTRLPEPPGGASDLRRRLCETKYFGLRPQPLERYLYRLNLTRSAERVFWLHWDAGLRHGDFCSEIPISQVAAACHLDTSSVTRAYQALKGRGLLRRQDPGRDPTRPFCQATALTEILLPREALAELFGAPDRRGRNPNVANTSEPATEPSQPVDTRTVATADDLPAPRKGEMKLALRALAKLTTAERARYENYRRSDTEQMEWDGTTQLTTEERELLTHSVLRARRARALDLTDRREDRHGDRPRTPGVNDTGEPASHSRRLSPFSLAYLRKKLTDQGRLADVPERLREIVWSLERGALARLELRLGMNVALKKLREGQWTRPHRMPPNWQLPDLT